MAAWSAEIANEFIRRAAAEGRALTQMQLQKLVYIAHGWNLAINGDKLTSDDPQAWDYGPVYRDLWNALRSYGRAPVTREIRPRHPPLPRTSTIRPGPGGTVALSGTPQRTGRRPADGGRGGRTRP